MVHERVEPAEGLRSLEMRMAGTSTTRYYWFEHLLSYEDIFFSAGVSPAEHLRSCSAQSIKLRRPGPRTRDRRV
jgi:hypothetical protein